MYFHLAFIVTMVSLRRCMYYLCQNPKCLCRNFNNICLFFDISFVFQTRSIGNLYQIFLQWAATFLPFLVSYILLQTIDSIYSDSNPILSSIQACLHRIYLNPYLVSTLLAENQIPVVFFPPYLSLYATPHIIPCPPFYSPSHPSSYSSSFPPSYSTSLLLN